MIHESNIAMPSTQLTLLICNNQCHPQSYPHHRSKSLYNLTFCYGFIFFLSRLPS